MGPYPAPLPAHKLSRREQILRGPVAVGAPGNFGGWAEMVRSYGTKKLPELFAPAIRIARDGFGMIEFNVEEYRGVTGELRGHSALYPEWSRNYVEGIDGGQPKLGALLKQPNLANTLEALGNEGPGLLYGGALGKKIIDRLTELGGCLGMDDLADFKAEWIEPVAVTYRGRTIHVPPPPCEAFQYLVTLRILEGFDLGKMERNGVEHVDTVLRAIRIAAGVRIANGVPTAQKLAELLSDGHIESLRARVRDGKPVTGPTEQWTPLPKDGSGEGHTTSFSIADAEGNVVCVTQSLGSVFGSGVVVPGTGVCLNNFLYWADVTPDSPNRVKHGDLMPVCVAPSIVTQDDKPVMALGTPGSYGILQTQPQAFVQYVDFALPIQQAIESPRGRLTDGRDVLLEALVGRRAGRAAQARPQRYDRSRLDDEGRRHAGRRDRSRDRRHDRRLRPPPRRLRRAGVIAICAAAKARRSRRSPRRAARASVGARLGGDVAQGHDADQVLARGRARPAVGSAALPCASRTSSASSSSKA